MNTPKVIESPEVQRIANNFYVVAMYTNPDAEFVTLRRARDDGWVAGFTKEEAIDLAQKILIRYQVPFCNRVKGS